MKATPTEPVIARDEVSKQSQRLSRLPRFARNDKKLLYVIIVVAVSFAVYSNALFNDFVFDDLPQVIGNPWIKDANSIPDIFSRDAWGFYSIEVVNSNYYRPMMHLIYMMNYFIFGLKPWGFHLVNIFFHVGVSVLVFLIAARLFNFPQRPSEIITPPIPYKNHNTPYPPLILRGGAEGGGAPPEIVIARDEISKQSHNQSRDCRAEPVLNMAQSRDCFAPLAMTGEGLAMTGEGLAMTGEGLAMTDQNVASTTHGLRFTIHDSRFTAFIAALLFAAHPVHTEAVTWIAGLTEVSFAFFCLLSFYLYISASEGITVHNDMNRINDCHSREGGNPESHWIPRQARNDRIAEYGFANGRLNITVYLLSIVSFFISTLCKETALVLPGILAAYDIFFKQKKLRLSGYLRRYAPFLLIISVYLIMRINALGGFAPVKRHAGLSAYRNIISIFPLFAQHIGKLFFPVNLGYFHFLRPIHSALEAKGLVSLIITAAFVACLSVSRKRNRLVFFSLLLIVIPLMPVLYIPWIGENSLAERYLYLPSFGFALLLGWLLNKGGGNPNSPPWLRRGRGGVFGEEHPERVRNDKFHRTYVVMTATILIFYCAGAIQRNKVWKDDSAFFADMISKNPNSGKPRYELGVALQYRGRIDEAVENYKTALSLEPDFPDARNMLGSAFFQKGWTDAAIEQYRLALRLNPDSPGIHYNIGWALFSKGLIDEALGEYRIALDLKPNYIQAHNDLGIALVKKGSIREAIEHFEDAVRLRPGNAVLRNNLNKAQEMNRTLNGEKGTTHE